MKNLETVNERIKYHRNQIEGLEELIRKEMRVISEKLTKNADDPIYISNWLDNWMTTVNAYKTQIENLYSTLEALEWVVSE